jgi:hypothetical protein
MHSPTDFGFLTKRIEKLEQQNRWFKIGAMFALLIVGSLVVIAARPANVQTAERFVLVDASGRTLAILGQDSDGLPGLSIRDLSSGKERAWLGLWGKGTEVNLGFYDQNQKERSRLGLNADGTMRLNINDAAGKLRTYLGQSDGGKESGVGFYDASERERAWMGIGGGTIPRVVLYSTDHKESWSTS